MKMMQLRSRPGNSRGFGIVMAIIGMAVVAGVVLIMGALFVHEGKRTRAAMADAQLRQLLVASVPAAKAELVANGDVERDVTVETPVEGARLVLHVQPVAGKAAVRASAVLRGFGAGQEMVFEKKAGGWEMTDVKLVRTSGE